MHTSSAFQVHHSTAVDSSALTLWAARLRRELLEDQYGTKNLPPSRKFEICDELAVPPRCVLAHAHYSAAQALPKPHAVHCLRELPIASHTKLEIFRELELGSQSVRSCLCNLCFLLRWCRSAKWV